MGPRQARISGLETTALWVRDKEGSVGWRPRLCGSATSKDQWVRDHGSVGPRQARISGLETTALSVRDKQGSVG